MHYRPACQSERIAYVDGLRGIAVLGVVLVHAIGSSARPSFAPYIVAVGARGVDLFFVLSGFCLSLAIVAPQGRSAEPKSPVAFLISRFARVAPPYYIALGVFAILSLTPFGLPTVAANPSATPVSMFGELLSEAAFITTSPLYNVSFWTLAIEMQWYLFCPLLIKLFVSSKPAFAVLLLALYALYASPWSLKLAGTLPCFMLGIVAAFLTGSRIRLSGYFVTVMAVVTLAFAVAQQSRTSEIDHGSALWHVACFLLVVAASYGHSRRFLTWKPLRMVGIASYSIYLVHQPFIAWGISHRVPPALAAAVAIGIGFGLWFAIERVVAISWQRQIEEYLLGTIARYTARTRAWRRAPGVR